MRGRTDRPLPEALYRLMAERGISEKDLTERTGLSPQAIARCLTDGPGERTKESSTEILREIGAVIEVSLEGFRGDRAWQIRRVARVFPRLVDHIYDLLVAEAEILDTYQQEEARPAPEGGLPTGLERRQHAAQRETIQQSALRNG